MAFFEKRQKILMSIGDSIKTGFDKRAEK